MPFVGVHTQLRRAMVHGKHMVVTFKIAPNAELGNHLILNINYRQPVFTEYKYSTARAICCA